MSQVEIKVPDIGDFKEVEVIELLVKPGDTVKPEQSLITVESDKASMEIPSSHAGIVKELKIKIGDKVAEGSLILLLEASEAAAAAPVAAAAASPSPAAPWPGTCTPLSGCPGMSCRPHAGRPLPIWCAKPRRPRCSAGRWIWMTAALC